MSRTSSARTAEAPFWRAKPLDRLSLEEWESLCDGCGKCCLHKLEDEETGEIAYTEVACSLFDPGTCHCTDYFERTLRIPDCVELTPRTLMTVKWLPSTCAYRLLHEGRDLPAWHPLRTGDPESVHRAGQSARGRTVREADAGPLEDHIVDWPE